MTQEQREQKARELLGKHHACEDRWYSCPLSEEGCCDDRQPRECNCGLDDNVRKLVELMAETERAVMEEVAGETRRFTSVGAVAQWCRQQIKERS
jgi:hypothetical protein